MTRRAAALGSAAFFALAPGIVAGAVPWSLTFWHVRHEYWLPLRIAGAVLIAAGAVALLGAFARFVLDGIGTPAPIAPTQRLVVRGSYRHVRNPMYLAVVATIIGQSLLLGQPGLLLYAAVVAAATGTFVISYEEPTLRRQFGEETTPTCGPCRDGGRARGPGTPSPAGRRPHRPWRGWPRCWRGAGGSPSFCSVLLF